MNVNEMYIEEDKTIREAMQQLDKNARKILFVHKNGILLATLTDGDIRRWILKNGDLQMPVRKVANYSPRYLKEGQVGHAVDIMKTYRIDAIPIVDEEHRIKEVVFLNGVEKQRGTFAENIPVVMMAGGKGARLSPYTNILPKPLIPIG